MRGRKMKATREKPTLKCCHYWIIEPPNGPMALGVCRNCGEVRQFNNSWPDMRRVDTRSSDETGELEIETPGQEGEQNGREN